MATISGCIVSAEHDGKKYEICVNEGVRGIDVPIDAEYIGNIWRISLEGKKLTIMKVVIVVYERRPY